MILEAKNLSFNYGARVVLDSLSLSVPHSKLCGLLGVNGSGKSTFFKCALNLLRAQGGEILIQGESSLNKSPAWLAKRVAYVPQESQFAFPFSALELVLMGRTPHMGGVFGLAKSDYEAAFEALSRVGMAEFANRASNELSGGQKQLLLLARALAQNTPLMLLDEPSSALDFRNQMRLWQLLKEVVNAGVSALVCSHEPNHILWFCDEVIVIDGGRLLAQGAPKDVLKDELLSRLYGDECALFEFKERGFIVPKGLDS